MRAAQTVEIDVDRTELRLLFDGRLLAAPNEAVDRELRLASDV